MSGENIEQNSPMNKNCASCGKPFNGFIEIGEPMHDEYDVQQAIDDFMLRMIKKEYGRVENEKHQ